MQQQQQLILIFCMIYSCTLTKKKKKLRKMKKTNTPRIAKQNFYPRFSLLSLSFSPFCSYSILCVCCFSFFKTTIFLLYVPLLQERNAKQEKKMRNLNKTTPNNLLLYKTSWEIQREEKKARPSPSLHLLFFSFTHYFNFS